MTDELWQIIPEFPIYSISSLGRVYNNRFNKFLRTSQQGSGHVKVALAIGGTGIRYTRSVALLVAEAFVEPPDNLADSVVLLDGNLSNVTMYNIVWRPRNFAWLYRRQLQRRQPLHFRNIRVTNLDMRIEYSCIIEAGMREGVLFDEIWDSTYLGRRIYPYGHKYRITERV